MSLKAFHVFFIVMAGLLCAVFGAWCLLSDYAHGHTGYVVAGYSSFAIIGLLIWYEIRFLRNLKEKKIQ